MSTEPDPLAPLRNRGTFEAGWDRAGYPVSCRVYDATKPLRNIIAGDCGTHEFAVAVAAALNLALAADTVPCTWTEEEEGNWTTSCGHVWVLTEGGPADNDMAYCPMCGCRLTEQRWTEPIESEEEV